MTSGEKKIMRKNKKNTLDSEHTKIFYYLCNQNQKSYGLTKENKSAL